jgi:hypothetical protein
MSALKSGQTATITLTFSEDPDTSLAWDATTQTGDLGVSGGSLGAISGSGLTRTAVFTPTAGLAAGQSSITVSAASYTDSFGNTGSAASAAVITIDTLAPTVSMTSGVSAVKSGETTSLRFRFSEAPLDFALADIVATHGSVTALAPTSDPLVFTAVFTPAVGFNGSANIAVAGTIANVASYTDLAGNAGSASNALTISIDTIAPTVLISSSALAVKAGGTANITFTFSEEPGASFAWDASNQTGGLTVVGGTVGAISGTGLIRTATFTPAPGFSGNASITVQAAGYADAAGNAGSASLEKLVEVDTLAPTLAITSNVAALKTGESASITFTFSEDPGTSFAWDGSTGDVTVAGGSLSTLIGTGLTRTATFTPTPNFNGKASITVAGTTFQDTAGNDGVSATTPLIAIDTLAPTVTLGSNVSALKSGQTASITFTFSEDPGTSFAWNGSTGDVTVAGGSLSALSGTGLTRTATFTPTPDTTGSASITVTNASYLDVAGNTGSAGSLPSISIDTLAPTLAITSSTAALKAGQTATITFTFSEVPATSLVTDASSVAVEGGTLGSFAATGDTKVFTAIFTPTAGLASGTASINVAGASYTDVAGNAGAAAPTALISIDTVAPTLAITSSTATLKSSQTATITFTFSEDPAGFAWDGTSGDIVVTGGTLGTLSGTGLTRSAIFTPQPNFNGSASITVAAASYTDAALNDGSGGLTPLISIDTVGPAVSSVAISSATGAQSKLLNAGDSVTLSVAMNDVTYVTGTPTLNINIGGTPVSATYVSGTGTQTLVFSYTILAGQNDADGISISADSLALADGTLLDAAGNPATLTHTALTANTD